MNQLRQMLIEYKKNWGYTVIYDTFMEYIIVPIIFIKILYARIERQSCITKHILQAAKY